MCSNIACIVSPVGDPVPTIHARTRLRADLASDSFDNDVAIYMFVKRLGEVNIDCK